MNIRNKYFVFGGIMFLLAMVSITTFAQNGPKLMLKQHYKMSFFKKSYIVGMEAKPGGTYDLYVNAEPMFVDHSDEMGIVVEHSDIPKFLSYLRTVRNKYASWIKVAHGNKVRSYSKEIPCQYTAHVYYRHQGYYYFQKGNAMQAWFTVDKNGNTYLKMSTRNFIADKVRNGGRFNMTFVSIGEIDELIRLIANSEKEYHAHQTEEMRLDALFQ